MHTTAKRTALGLAMTTAAAALIVAGIAGPANADSTVSAASDSTLTVAQFDALTNGSLQSTDDFGAPIVVTADADADTSGVNIEGEVSIGSSDDSTDPSDGTGSTDGSDPSDGTSSDGTDPSDSGSSADDSSSDGSSSGSTSSGSTSSGSNSSGSTDPSDGGSSSTGSGSSSNAPAPGSSTPAPAQHTHHTPVKHLVHALVGLIGLGG